MKQFSITLRKILLCDFLYYLLLIISILYLFIYINIYIPHYVYEITDTNFEVIILNYYIDGDKLSIELKGKEKLIGTYYFKNLEEMQYFKDNYFIGDTLLIEGKLSYPKNNTIPNTFNYKKYLLYKNVNYIISIDKINKYKDNDNVFYKFKNYFIKRIDSITNNEYLYAFILGNSKYIDSEIMNNYKINGITHLFALSGLHVSIFANMFLKLFKKVNEKSSLIIVSIILILLCFITSFSPSIIRATIFFILQRINKIYYTFIKTKYLLFITFSIMIFINPFYVYNLGFVLSFTITYFLLFSNDYIKSKNKIYALFIMSLIASLGSLPIIINNFYKINIIGFINNIFFVPYVSNIVYPFSLLTFIFNFLNPILFFFISIMEYISDLSTKLLNINIYFSKLTISNIIIYYSILLSVIKYRKKILICIFVLYLVFLNIKKNFNNNTCVYFMDVGQGDSILINTKNNYNILIDTGGKEIFFNSQIKRNKNFNLMNDSMIPFFNSLGITKIDYLFLTHGDADHSGYAHDLINNMKVKKIFINKGNINYLESTIPHNILLDNYIKIDNIDIYSLNYNIYDNENDNSLILLIKIYNYQILLMGDASVKNENDILSKYDLSNITILKLGHHGSNTSTSDNLLLKTNPKYSIISASLNNKYNHPSKSTIDKLTKYNLTYYETSKYGTIQFCFDNNMKQNTYNP